MELFKRLGDDIELAWRELNFDELALPGVAKQKLAEFQLPVSVSPWDVVAWTLARPQLPHQHDVPAAFGEPPITIYNSNRFHIDVYFWFTGTTATHQHGFSGAFQVMSGSSIHSTFRFTEDDAVNEY